MPISSGALDWPVSYYTKPASTTDKLSESNIDLDIWSRDHAYRDWMWKSKKIKRKKKKKQEWLSHEDERLHRRRCCCCVVWWLTAFALILLTLIFFMVFWIRSQASDLPPVSPEIVDNLPHCVGKWRDTFVLYNNTNGSYACCYGPDSATLATLFQKGDMWPEGYVAPSCPPGNSKCETALPDDPVCGSVQLERSWWTLLTLAFFSMMTMNLILG